MILRKVMTAHHPVARNKSATARLAETLRSGHLWALARVMNRISSGYLVVPSICSNKPAIYWKYSQHDSKKNGNQPNNFHLC